MKKYGIIYIIKNVINNKLYIGQTMYDFKTRYQNNLYKNTDNVHLKKSIEKYGLENFVIDEEFDVAYSKEELDKLEKMYINIYETMNREKGYNKMSGGSNGRPNEETKRKMSESHLGIMHTEESKKLMSEIKKGIKPTVETKKKMSESRKKYLEEHPEIKEKVREQMKKRGMTKEIKKKISNSKKGVKLSEEHKRKLREVKLGKKLSEEHKESIKRAHRKRSKKIVCVETGKIYESISECSEELGINAPSISGVLKGRLKTAGKLHFEYFKGMENEKEEN